MRDESRYRNYGSINVAIPGKFDQTYYEKTAQEYNAMFKYYMPTSKRANILDIGCGKGFFLYYLKQQGYSNFYGIDADLFSIDHTQNHVTEKCEYVYAEEFLSDKIDVYDLIIMNEVLEHIPKEEIVPLLKTIWNSLHSDGNLICYVPNMENPFSSYTRYHDFTHTIGFTQNSLRMVLSAAGFSETNIIIPEGQKKGIKRIIKLFLRKIIEGILIRLFEYPKNGIIYSSRIFSVAKK
jgi:2-polyprenyl-3-methyl-5-hydroxy-6-metoxy-1,4-benzoquinol methylase